MAFLACVHLALFLALSLSPRNSLVSSLCDYSMHSVKCTRWRDDVGLLSICYFDHSLVDLFAVDR